VFDDKLKTHIAEVLQKLRLPEVEVDLAVPRDPSHGDAATTIAMGLAKQVGRNPHELATEIVEAIDHDAAQLDSAEVAGPGFINFRYGAGWYDDRLRGIVREGEAYGRSAVLDGQRILLEFVSANPTGPLNIVSARAAAVGDAIASLLEAAGCEVHREFYVNDAGVQVQKLALSVEARIRELAGEPLEIPEGGYHGEYLIDVAKVILAAHQNVLSMEEDERLELLKREAVERMVASQRADLDMYGVTFDRWFHETELEDRVDRALDALRATGETYESEGAEWLKTTPHGTNDDKVIVKADGYPTYLLPDLAYHIDKFDRGYDPAIDLWGPDHHAHIAEMHAALEILGHSKEQLEVQIIQQVNFLENGQRVKMSKRAGSLVTLRELCEDVGVDVAKFFFLMRKTASHLDFDLDLAREQSDENPVYYVQYGHARVASLIRFAEERGTGVPHSEAVDLSDVTSGGGRVLILLLADFPRLIAAAAEAREPHRLTTYLRDVASQFHKYYHDHRIVSDDEGETAARLFLSEATRTVLSNGLALLGVSAPDRM
jgi:arginyl-tRNA synthetase